MQRTNILRDIDEDSANGRVYLARETLERFGGRLSPGGREALLRDQIARADALYDDGRGRHPRCCAAGAARSPRPAAMYREILRQIEREGYGAQPGRAVVPGPRKLLVAARSRASRRSGPCARVYGVPARLATRCARPACCSARSPAHSSPTRGCRARARSRRRAGSSR